MLVPEVFGEIFTRIFFFFSERQDCTYIADLLDENLASLANHLTECNQVPKIAHLNQGMLLGVTKEVNVSHINSLNDFYVQLVENSGKLDVLMETLDQHCASGSKVTSVVKGQACAAQFSEDSGWYRASVIDIHGTSIKVHYVDYGNAEERTINNIQALPPDLLKDPPYAMQCSVPGASDQLLTKFQSAVSDKNINAHFKTCNSGKWHLVISELEAEKGIGPVAVENEESQVTLTDINVVIGQEYQCYVSHIEDLREFYVQPCSNEANIETITNTLGEKYDSLASAQSLSKADLGTFCCALYIEDENWYRAEVSQVTSAGKVKVHFIDFGNYQDCESCVLKSIPKELLKYKKQAIRCELDNCSNGQTDVTSFSELVSDKIVTIKFKEGSRFGYKVSVKIDGTLINEQFQSSEKARETVKAEGTITEIHRLEVGSRNDAVISFAISPYEFYVQLLSTQGKLDSVMEKLATAAEKGLAKTKPVRNLDCCTTFSEDGEWYRASIGAVTSDGVDVHFMDFGNCEKKHQDEIYELPSEIKKIPPLAYRCRLSGCLGQFSVSQTDQFVTEMSTKEIEMTIEKIDDEFLYVKMFDGSTDIGEKYVVGDLSLESPAVVVEYPEPDIKLNTQEIVVVSVVVSFNEFYGQPVKGLDALDTMMDKLHNHYSDLQETEECITHPVKGMPCCAKYSDDGGWYRAVIDKIEDSKIQVRVQFVDYGNYETVSLRDAKVLKPEFVEIPPFALKFALDKAELMGDPQENLTEFKAVVLENEFMASLLHIEKGTVIVKLQDSEKCVNEVMIKESVVAERSSAPTVSTKDNVDITRLKFTSGECLDVYIVHSESPNEFYCQPVQYENALIELMDNIASYIDTENAVACTPDIGMFCIAQYSADNGYYRSRITNIDRKSNQCEVLFLDYGNKEWVAGSSMKTLPSKFRELHQQAVLCCLSLIQPKGSSWTNGALEIFRAKCTDKMFKATVDGEKDGKICVTLKDPENGEIINDSLVDCNFAVRDKMHVKQPIESSEKLQYTLPKISSGVKEDVICTFVHSEELISCQLVKYQGQLDNLMENISVHCNTSNVTVTDPVTDQPVLALYSEDGVWYRAKVLAVQNSSVSVRFIDFGNEEEVQFSNLRDIRDDDLKLPITCIDCRISGLMSDSQDGEERKVAVEEMCLEQKFVAEFHDTSASDHMVGNIYLQGNAQSDNDELASIKAEVENSERSHDTFAKPNIMFGSRETVVCTYISDDCKLSCQLCTYEEPLNQLMAEIAIYCEESNSADPGLICPGMACCARYPDDDTWYRATVKSVSSDEVEVYFVDYGNFCNVPNTDIREIKENLMNLPEACLNIVLPEKDSCCATLADIKTWMESTCLDQVMTLEVKEAIETEATYFGVLSLQSDEDKTVNSLLKQHFSKKYASPDISVDSNNSFVCTEVSSVIQLQCQVSAYLDKLDILMGEVGKHCNSDSVSVHNPFPGMPCLSLYVDENWYRAIVLSVTDSKAIVRCVDYGTSYEVDFANLRQITDEFMGLPEVCVTFKLRDVFEEDFDPAAAKEWLEETCLDQHLTASDITTEKDGTFSGYLFIAASTDSVNDSLYYAFAGHEETLKRNDEVGTPNEGAVYKETSELKTEEGNEKEAMQNQETLTQKEEPLVSLQLPRSSQGFLKPELSPNFPLSVLITHVDSPSVISCQLQNYAKSLESISSKIVELAETSSRTLTHPTIGSACIAKFREDDTWYRARVLSTSSLHVNVYFVDYGNTDSIALTDTRIITEDLLELPETCISCTLHDVFDGELNVESAKLWLEELVIDQEFQMKLVSMSNDRPGVRLFMKGNTDGPDCLSGTVNEELYVKFKLPKGIDEKQSPAVFEEQNDRSELIEAAIVEEPSKLRVDKESEKGVEDGTQHFEQKGATENAFEEVRNLVEATELENISLSLKTPEIIVGSIEPVLVTHIVTTSKIFCQLQKYDQELTAISEELALFATSSEDRLMNPSINTPCVAKFHADGSWYRAKVLSVGTDSVTVRFVDYGNSDTVSLEDTRVITDNFLHLPEASLACSLYDVHDTDLDDTNAQAWLESLADEIFHAKIVTAEAVEIAVKLFMNNEAETINDQLYEKFGVFKEPDTAVPDENRPVNGLDEGIEEDLKVAEAEGTDIKGPGKLRSCESPALETNVDSKELGEERYEPETSFKNDNEIPVDDDLDRLALTNRIPSISSQDNKLEQLEEKSKRETGEGCSDLMVTDRGNVDKELQLEAKNHVSETPPEEAKEKEEPLAVENAEDGKSVSSEAEMLEDLIDKVSAQVEETAAGQNGALHQVSLDNETECLRKIVAASLSPGTMIPLNLSLATSPNTFWGQFLETANELEELMEEIAEVYSSDNVPAAEIDPQIGEFYSAQFTEDEGWYRGKVVETFDDNEFLVQFIDYGNFEKLSKIRLKTLQNQFFKLPAQAVECSLHGIKPVEPHGLWSASASSRFEEICAGVNLSAEIIDIVNDKAQVILKADNQNETVNDLLVQEGFAVKIQQDN